MRRTRRGSLRALNLYEGKVGILVTTNYTAFELTVVIQFYIYHVCITHNMIVGDDISVGTDYHTASGTVAVRRLIFALLWRHLSLPEEFSEELGKGIANLNALGLSVLGNLDLRENLFCSSFTNGVSKSEVIKAASSGSETGNTK